MTHHHDHVMADYHAGQGVTAELDGPICRGYYDEESTTNSVADALAAGLLLSPNGEHLHNESPLGCPLPDDLRQRLLGHKQEVLAWLDFCAAADELLLACWVRLVRAYPAGLSLDEERQRAAEEALQRAHHSADLDVFRSALAACERCSLDQFSQRHEKEER